MTVKELIAQLKGLPDDMIVSSEGADCGGYDVEVGTNISVEVNNRYGRAPTCHICHDSNDSF